MPRFVQIGAAVGLLIGCLGVIGATVASVSAHGPQEWTVPVVAVAFGYLAWLAGPGAPRALLIELLDRWGKRGH
jgi:hypothetical protein